MGPIAHDSKEISQCNIHLHNNGVSLRVYQLGSVGNGPTVLLLHGFPECWYSWRYQMGALHKAGFHVVAIDLRGYGLSDVPERQEDYTCMHYVGDVVGLLDALSLHQVFVIGHDWGALVGWDLCLLRPDRVKGYVAVSVPYSPRLADTNLLKTCTEFFGEGFYMNQFQIPGKFEAEIVEAGISKSLQVMMTTEIITPEMLSKPANVSILSNKVGKLPHWFTEDDLKYYTEQFKISGFTGPLNYYRNIERSWELKAPWTNVLVHTPSLFITGKRDLVVNFPSMDHLIKGGGLKQVLPNLHEIIIIDGGHFVHEENAEEFNAAVIKFFEGGGVGGPSINVGTSHSKNIYDIGSLE